MNEKRSTMEKYDSLNELQIALGENKAYIYGLKKDEGNVFYKISTESGVEVGITYYDCGIKPQVLFTQDMLTLYIGFDKQIICLNLITNKLNFEKEVSSIFYEFVMSETQKYICVVCELDVYVYDNIGEYIWTMGFRDIVNEYSINDMDKLFISCDNGEEFIFKLCDGSIE